MGHTASGFGFKHAKPLAAATDAPALVLIPTADYRTRANLAITGREGLERTMNSSPALPFFAGPGNWPGRCVFEVAKWFKAGLTPSGCALVA